MTGEAPDGTAGVRTRGSNEFGGPSKALLVAAVAAYLCLTTVGIVWWVGNLGTIPAYGDTSQYLQLAESLRVDSYRTLFYPLLLRAADRIARSLDAPRQLPIYVLQTAAALLSLAYLGRTLWDVTAGSERFAFLATASPRLRRLMIGSFAVVVFTAPLVNHFALSVMTDSLAASFTTAGTAALVRIAVLGDVRLATALAAWTAIAAAGWMRAEKVGVFALVILSTLAALGRGRGVLAFSAVVPRAKRVRVLALLVTLLLTPGAVVLVVNRATQTADYGWPPLTVSVRLFVRTAWPRLAAIRPLLSPEAQAAVSQADAERFDANYNEYLSLVPRLQRTARGSDRLVNEISFTALRRRWIDIAASTVADALEYAVPMVAYPLDLTVRATPGSWWTYSRMNMAHPTLTRVYLIGATAVLLAVQLPLLVLGVIHRPQRDPRVRLAIGLIVGTALVNGVLYALGNGLQNVRYALPASMLVYATIVWANVALLALLWRKGVSARSTASDGASGGH